MKQIDWFTCLQLAVEGKKAEGKNPASQRGDISPEMEQEDNGQTFGKIALVTGPTKVRR